MESDREPDSGAVRAESSMLKPAQVGRFPLTKPLLFVLAILFIFPGATSIVSLANFDNYYPKYCSDMLPLSPPLEAATTDSVQSLTGYFSASVGRHSISGVSFQPAKAFKTGIQGLIKLRGSLVLMDPNAMIPKNPGNSTKGRRLRVRNFHVRGPSLIPLQRRDRARFKLYGYWSQSSGKLCMIGSTLFHANGGKLHSYDALLKLNYPVQPSINASLITGILESLDGSDSLNDQFESVSLLGLIKNVDYDYTLMEKERGKASFNEFGGEENLSLERINQDVCTAFRWNSALELEYDSFCSNTSNNCNPLGRDVQFSPKIILLTRIKCSSEGKMRLLMKFRNSTNFFYNVDYYGFDPSITFIGEGEWDRKENRLCAVVCRFLNFSESLSDTFIGDCSIRLCLSFPSSLSLKSRSPLVGQVWTTKPVDDSGYFMKVGLQGSGKPLTGMKYEYNSVASSRPTCVKPKNAKRKGKIYPDPTSRDMSFDMLVKDSKGLVARGYSAPFFVANQLYDSSPFGLHYFEVANQTTTTTTTEGSSSVSLQNISYTMSFTVLSTFKVGSVDFSPNKTVEILAEGTYNREYGSLCMVGCRRLRESSSRSSSSFDCEIQVDVEFPPLKAKSSEKTKGSIQSTRDKSDPLYFEPFQLSSNSAYLGQVQESIWRMDLEIVMVLISNSLTCIFLGLQLYHVKKHPNTISLISMLMLVVLTLGLMTPLILNFEALFDGKSNRPNYILGASGGWLEVNEVVVRVVTMVAFLLQLRLLQLNWSARTQNGLSSWASEKKVVYVLLPLYISGGLIAWFVFLWKNSTTPSNLLSQRPQLSLWEHSRSYAGLVLDGFLLPQILFNMFSDSTETSLASSFYIGITMVRLLPHGYDLCRAQISAWYPDISYIYANHRMDFYSTAWDIIIPCSGVIFAIIILLQQRFGGRVLLPRRFRTDSSYNKVPSIEL